MEVSSCSAGPALLRPVVAAMMLQMFAAGQRSGLQSAVRHGPARTHLDVALKPAYTFQPFQMCQLPGPVPQALVSSPSDFSAFGFQHFRVLVFWSG